MLSPPVAVTVPPEMVVVLVLKIPSPQEPSLPVLSPPVAVTVPPEMVRSLLKMPLPPFSPLSPLAVRLSVSPPVMVRLPLLEMPLPPEPLPLPLPPVRWFSPFRVSVTSPFEVRAEPESALMFTSLSVTSTLSFPASMVTVWEEAVSVF